MHTFVKNDTVYKEYIRILEAELLPATGCTEPIAVAYAAAKARAVLGAVPDTVTIEASGNIIKNVKSVVVPNTDGMKGLEAAAAAGIIAGKEDALLEVIAQVSPEERNTIADYYSSCKMNVVPVHNGKVFYISLIERKGNDVSRVTIEDFHTNITYIEKNSECIFRAVPSQEGQEHEASLDYELLNIEDIVAFADMLDPADIDAVLSRQIVFNSAISAEGLKNAWGAQVGRTLLLSGNNDVRTRARAAAAAGSDARMSGCEMPVVIVSGSGNQGMTASLPVIEYARELNSTKEQLLRALTVADLVTIYQKTSIGRLSAFCGATSAGCGAAAGVAYLRGCSRDVISHTVTNTLAMLSGMVCDGAKPSCAAKIAMAVEAGLLGLDLYLNDKNQFRGGEGILRDQVDDTIRSVGRMARLGMRETDREILDIMTGSC